MSDDLLADAWEQGYLYSHFQERQGPTDGRLEVPWHLVDAIRMWNPYRQPKARESWCVECGAFHPGPQCADPDQDARVRGGNDA